MCCFALLRRKIFLSTDPPAQIPLITGAEKGGLTEGEPLTLSCSVTGGQPPVTGVTFWCADDSGDSPDTKATVNSVTTLTSNVAFDRLDFTMNGTVCKCYANWAAKPILYTPTATVTITVIGMYVSLYNWLLDCSCLRKDI